MTEELLDVLIIGGGPNALALAARLYEPRPAALYTEAEHARLHWLGRSKHKNAQNPKRLKARKISSVPGLELKVLAVDAAGGEWMSNWNTMFSNLEIKHLRSPMFFHPAPNDVDALVAFAERNNMSSHLREICGCVGKENSKHLQKQKRNGKHMSQTSAPVNERDRRDFFTPSTALFESFIKADVIKRYNLEKKIAHARVINLSYEADLGINSDVQPGFIVTLENCFGEVKRIQTKAVAVACGNGGFRNIPSLLSACLKDRPSLDSPEYWCHSNAFARKDLQFPPLRLANEVCSGRPTSLLVIGGGLTAAQIASLAISRGVCRVTLLVRNRFRSKHFDLDLEWVTKYQNILKMQWHQEEDYHQRIQAFKRAKGGGSVTPHFYHLCKKLESKGRLRICEKSTMRAVDFSDNRWNVELDLNGTRLTEEFDYVVAATGNTPDIEKLPFMRDFLEKNPTEIVNGFPVLDSNCQWPNGIPLFMRRFTALQIYSDITVGAYSLLETGPAAFNLVSTRESSERVVHGLGKLGIGISDASVNNADPITHGGLFDALEVE